MHGSAGPAERKRVYATNEVEASGSKAKGKN